MRLRNSSSGTRNTITSLPSIQPPLATHQRSDYLQDSTLSIQVLNEDGPVYLKDLLTFDKPALNLRSADDSLTLTILRTKLITYGDRAFSVKTAAEWNKPLLKIRSSESVALFVSTQIKVIQRPL